MNQKEFLRMFDDFSVYLVSNHGDWWTGDICYGFFRRKLRRVRFDVGNISIYVNGRKFQGLISRKKLRWIKVGNKKYGK